MKLIGDRIIRLHAPDPWPVEVIGCVITEAVSREEAQRRWPGLHEQRLPAVPALPYRLSTRPGDMPG